MGVDWWGGKIWVGFVVVVVGGGGTLVSVIQKDKKMQNANKPKKIVRLNLIDALMCPKT